MDAVMEFFFTANSFVCFFVGAGVTAIIWVIVLILRLILSTFRGQK